ncbi:MAG: ATP-binding cassette domain-containing protein [Armatimonadetes bacterium]|nr:ATP-binding cassette domain-containing protein [Armatimonadota bacterium]MDE2207094.1 ATP-binding cassette domain-containing protein [Armatimonadota bacterium]
MNAVAPQPSGADPWLVASGISKRFGQTQALDAVDLEAGLGEIHAVLGENGAGKSTLMHILAGLIQPDEGAIRLAGIPAQIDSARAARRLGISMVHQHFSLVPAFTVAENLSLDALLQPGNRAPERRVAGGVLNAAKPALRKAAELGWTLEPQAITESLPVGTQQRVEIAKALAFGARCVIFDEPTAVLSVDEVGELFRVLRQLRDGGASVLLIAHKLNEITAIADRVTVLRQGRRVFSGRMKETSTSELAASMVGTAPPPAGATITPQPDSASSRKFTVSNLTVLSEDGRAILTNVSFSAPGGQVYGIGGVDGNGQAELAELLAGIRWPQIGSLSWSGLEPSKAPPRVAYVPPDRRHAGLAVDLPVWINLVWDAAAQPEYARCGLLRIGRLRALARQMMQDYDIRAGSIDTTTSKLSGGNQQKIVVARALHARPDLLIAVNPARGLDIGASKFVLDSIASAARAGAAVILFSTDLDELRAYADQLAIVAAGELRHAEGSWNTGAGLGMLIGGASSTHSDTA